MNRYLLLCLSISCLSACNGEDILKSTNLNNSYRCADSADIQEQALRLINNARETARQCGSEYFHPAPPVVWNSNLQKAAKKHSDDMAVHNFFDHTGSDNSDAGERIVEQNYNWITYGENIAAGVQNTQQAANGWLDSPGHCANIMNPLFTEMGVACSRKTGTTYVTYWTQVFATPY